MNDRPWDPFAPPVQSLTGAVQPPVADALPEDLDKLKKPELVALADQHAVDTDGTRDDIIARLRAL